ncbi:MAG: MBL fold metallo-hydrolase [Lachnotalea sp.]
MEQSIIWLDLKGVNAYLIKEENNFVLIDTGGYLVTDKPFDNRRDKIIKKINEAGVTKDNLKLIILTHGDSDHVMNGAFISQEYEVPVAIHKNDLEMVQNPTIEVTMKSFNYNSLIMKIVAKLIFKLIKKVTIKTLNDFESFTPEVILEEGSTLEKYGIHATIIHIPGHTPGSVGIYTQSKGFIAGDTFFGNKKPTKAMNAFDYVELDKSIEKVKKLDIKKIYPGHGTPFDFKDFK